MKYWLMKSEPDVFSIDDLIQKKSALWDGVRNYQARNFMTNDMKIGDSVLFYHSSAEPPGVAGIAKIVGAAEPDPTQFDKKSDGFEKKATAEKPMWFCVRVGDALKFPRVVELSELRKEKALSEMLVLKKGQRLSIQPVTQKEFECVCTMAKR